MADGINWGDAIAQSMPALGTLLGGGSRAMDIEAQSDAILSEMDSASDSFAFSTDINASRIDELDRAVGDKMTERGMQAVKAEARLRASSAETGTTGGTTSLAVKDAYMQQSLDNAVTIRDARTTKVSMLREQQANRLSYNNRLESLASGIESPLQSGLSTANAGLQGFSSGLNFMNTTQTESFFNTGGGVSSSSSRFYSSDTNNSITQTLESSQDIGF